MADRRKGGGELGADIAGEIGVGRLPGSRFRVGEDQLAQFGHNVRFRFAIEFPNERQFHRAALVEGNEQPFLGALNMGDGRGLADHILGHDGGFFRFVGLLVILFQRTDQHGVRVFTELDQVGHPADESSVFGFAEGGLVDRAVGPDETVVGPIQFPTRLAAVLFGPAFVLRLQDAAGAVAQADQCGHAPAGERGIGPELRAAIDDGDSFPTLGLVNDAIVADEETALADMAIRRRRYECRFARAWE